CDPFRVDELFLDTSTQGALRDPGLWSGTPSGYERINVISRREWLSAVGAGAVAASAAPAADRPADEPFLYCLNTSTISGQKLPLAEEVEIAARAGFNAIEPWIRELDEYTKKGGNLKDLGKRIKDNGLSVESAIGFFEWIVDDDDRRKKGLE